MIEIYHDKESDSLRIAHDNIEYDILGLIEHIQNNRAVHEGCSIYVRVPNEELYNEACETKGKLVDIVGKTPVQKWRDNFVYDK